MLIHTTSRAYIQEDQSPLTSQNNLNIPISSPFLISPHHPHSHPFYMLGCLSSPYKNPLLSPKFSFHPLKKSMDSSANRPSPGSLQGPRPTPLKVRKDSYKISKKPPTIPNNSNQPPPQLPPQPVIIYMVSPKIIHTNPADFMTLVQRLTGPDSAEPSIPSPSAALSPAARFATFEKAGKPSPHKNYPTASNNHIINIEDRNGLLDRTSTIPGILSPQPSSLQPISSSFFSPIANFDPGSLSFLNDLSPFAGADGGGSGGNNFMISPNNFLSTPTITSPGSYWDLFNDF